MIYSAQRICTIYGKYQAYSCRYQFLVKVSWELGVNHTWGVINIHHRGVLVIPHRLDAQHSS